MRYSRLLIIVGSVLIFSCKKNNDVPPTTQLTGEEFLSRNYGNIVYHYEMDDAGRTNRFLEGDTSGLVWTSAIISDSVVKIMDLAIGYSFSNRYSGSIYSGKPSGMQIFLGPAANPGSRYQYSYDGSGRITKITNSDGAITDISYDGKGNIARIYQMVKQGTNYILYSDITPVHYDNHPTPYSLSGKGLFFATGMDGAQADMRTLLMLSKNNATEVHYRGFDQVSFRQVIYQAVIEYSYNDKGYPTDMAVTASDSIYYLNQQTNHRLLYKNHFNYQNF